MNEIYADAEKKREQIAEILERISKDGSRIQIQHEPKAVQAYQLEPAQIIGNNQKTIAIKTLAT